MSRTTGVFGGSWLRKVREMLRGPSRSELKKDSPLETKPGGDRRRSPESHDPIGRHAVSINLGVDFGTAFTKICYRDVGREESGIVSFGAQRADGATVPSAVSLTEDGGLRLGEVEPSHNTVRYLKMLLAGLDIPASVPNSDGIDLSAPDAVAALSSWYLASVIERSQEWIRKHEAERLEGREVRWSANVGVPVEYCDSAVLVIFEDVLKVAWAWVLTNDRPQRLEGLLGHYERTKQSIDGMPTDSHAVPEIAAAAQSYLTSREATPDVYLYFDIGAGTVDGVAFRYAIIDGTRRVNFYSGRVRSLGVATVAQAVGSDERTLARHPLSSSLYNRLVSYGKQVQKLVGYVVMTAKRKEEPEWQSLSIFLGGGGAGVKWYRDWIEETYYDFKMDMAAIPQYTLKEIPKPTDLKMNGVRDADYGRFAVAYGLSVPYGEGPDIGLPSQFPVQDPPQPIKDPNVVDYHDTKDIYE